MSSRFPPAPVVESSGILPLLGIDRPTFPLNLYRRHGQRLRLEFEEVHFVYMTLY